MRATLVTGQIGMLFILEEWQGWWEHGSCKRHRHFHGQFYRHGFVHRLWGRYVGIFSAYCQNDWSLDHQHTFGKYRMRENREHDLLHHLAWTRYLLEFIQYSATDGMKLVQYAVRNFDILPHASDFHNSPLVSMQLLQHFRNISGTTRLRRT